MPSYKKNPMKMTTAQIDDDSAKEQPTVKSVIEIALCEQNFLVLRPNTLYRLTPRANCAECERLANIYAEAS